MQRWCKNIALAAGVFQNFTKLGRPKMVILTWKHDYQLGNIALSFETFNSDEDQRWKYLN